MAKTLDLTNAPAPRLCAETIARSPNLASAAEKLGCTSGCSRHQFELFRQEVVITVDARRDILLDRLEIGMAALMPAVENGDNAAMQSLAKLTRETGILVPGLAQSNPGGSQFVVQVSWLEGNRLSYADGHRGHCDTPGAGGPEMGPFLPSAALGKPLIHSA